MPSLTSAPRPVKVNRKPQPRTAKLMQLGTSTVLALTCGKLTTFYLLTILDRGFGEAAFRLEKPLNNGGEVYDVCIDGPRSTCECLGFLKHKHCKHLESIESLIAAGKLPACKVQPPTPKLEKLAPSTPSTTPPAAQTRECMECGKPCTSIYCDNCNGI